MARVLTSQRALADALGCAPSTISVFLRGPLRPRSVSKSGPWSDADVQKIKQARFALQDDRSDKAKAPQPDAGPPESSGMDLGQIKLKGQAKQAIDKARIISIQADLAEGVAIKRELADAAVVAIISRVLASWVESHELLLDQLPGSKRKIKALLNQAFIQFRRELIEEGVIRLDLLDAEVKEAIDGRRRSRGRKTSK